MRVCAELHSAAVGLDEFLRFIVEEDNGDGVHTDFHSYRRDQQELQDSQVHKGASASDALIEVFNNCPFLAVFILLECLLSNILKSYIHPV